MSLVIFSTICSLFVLYFAVMPTLELAMIIILVIYLDSNVMDIVMLNLKSIKLSHKPAGDVSFYLTFLDLYSLMVAWSIDLLYSIHNKSLKIGLALFTMLLIAGLENLTKKVNAVTYVNWNWLHDIIQWLTIWLISFIMLDCSFWDYMLP